MGKVNSGDSCSHWLGASAHFAKDRMPFFIIAVLSNCETFSVKNDLGPACHPDRKSPSDWVLVFDEMLQRFCVDPFRGMKHMRDFFEYCCRGKFCGRPCSVCQTRVIPVPCNGEYRRAVDERIRVIQRQDQLSQCFSMFYVSASSQTINHI